MDVIGTLLDRKSRVDDSAGEQYVPSSYFTLDVLWRAKLGERWQLNAAIFSLTDEKYWEWADVRGRRANDAAIDRYSRPGIDASASVSFAF